MLIFMVRSQQQQQQRILVMDYRKHFPVSREDSAHILKTTQVTRCKNKSVIKSILFMQNQSSQFLISIA